MSERRDQERSDEHRENAKDGGNHGWTLTDTTDETGVTLPR
jgi:hypothetical protein